MMPVDQRIGSRMRVPPGRGFPPFPRIRKGLMCPRLRARNLLVDPRGKLL